MLYDAKIAIILFPTKFLRDFFKPPLYPLYIVFSRIHQSCPQGVLGGLMDIVHTDLPEDVLTMRVHGMETRETLVGNFLRRQTQSDILQYLRLGLRQPHLISGWHCWCQQDLSHTLTDISLMAQGILDAFTNLCQRRVFQQDAELRTDGDRPADEVGGEFETEQDPVHLGKTFVKDLQLVDIINIKR